MVWEVKQSNPRSLPTPNDSGPDVDLKRDFVGIRRLVTWSAEPTYDLIDDRVDAFRNDHMRSIPETFLVPGRLTD
jgi:hypothetical protein